MKELLITLPAIMLLVAGCNSSPARPATGQNQLADRPTESQNQPVVKPAGTISQMNPQDYSLNIYPIAQSPVYGSLSADCLNKINQFTVGRMDFRLLDKNGEIIIPSLKQLIYNADKSDDQPECYDLLIDIFSKPSNGNYLYLKSYSDFGNDVPYSGINALYRLDLSNLSLKKLTVADFIANFDLYRGGEDDTYKILPDGKRLIKWDQRGVYLINLEADTNTTLYQAPNNSWLISDVYFEMGQVAGYDIKITDNKIEVGVYDKTKTLDGKSVTVDQYDNVDYDGYYNEDTGERENDIKLKFKERVTLTIPE